MDTIVHLQNSITWKIQLTTAINFISSEDAKEDRGMKSKSNNRKSSPYNNANEVFHELFRSLNSRY